METNSYWPLLRTSSAQPGPAADFGLLGIPLCAPFPTRLYYGTQIGPVLKSSQVLAAIGAPCTDEAQKNPPRTGRSGQGNTRKCFRWASALMRPEAGCRC